MLPPGTRSHQDKAKKIQEQVNEIEEKISIEQHFSFCKNRGFP